MPAQRMALMTVFFVCLTVLVLPTGAWAVTQGDFALLLAQKLGFEVDSIESALKALDDLDVSPERGWKAVEEMTPREVKEVEVAVAVAMAAGLLKPVLVEGAVADVAAALGIDYQTPVVSTQHDISIPWYAPIGGPLNDPVFLEGSPFRPR